MTQEIEKELVLGNKQLISLFFVIVALCGVFFAMGYMMGRNTSKPGGANPEASAGTATGAAPVAAAAQSQDSEPPRETVADANGTTPPDNAPAASPQPGTTVAAVGTPGPTTPVPTVETKPALDAPITPDTGAIWLQVTALRRTDADNLVKTLREQKLPAVLANSSKPDLFRVMVGPYHQTADVADAKARLKALGFADAFVQK